MATDPGLPTATVALEGPEIAGGATTLYVTDCLLVFVAESCTSTVKVWGPRVAGVELRTVRYGAAREG